DAAPPSTSYTSSTFSGTLTPGGTDIGNHCDDCTTTIFPPFPITVYDSVVTSLDASSNGEVHVGSFLFENPATCLPTTIFGLSVMPLWVDLRTDLLSGSGIFTQTTGTAPNRQFHVRWNASYYTAAAGNSTGNAQFEIVFYENSAKIEYVYG